MTNHFSIPKFDNLPNNIKSDLTTARCDQWYRDAQSPLLQLGLLNIYAKMKSDNLWPYVNKCLDSPKPGSFKFEINDMDGLKSNLFERNDYTNPTRSWNNYILNRETLWDSHSKDSLGQLHLKYFIGYEPNQIHTHVDVQGLNWYNPLQWLRHGIMNPWDDPYKVNNTLMQLPKTSPILTPLWAR